MTRPLPWRTLIWALALSYATAGIGGVLTDLGPWYQALKQPEWKPADLWFGPIWTTIFTLAAISVWLAWHEAKWPAQQRRVVVLFVVNAVCNVGWSALFFALKRPDWAMWEWGVLWLSVASLSATADQMVFLLNMLRTRLYIKATPWPMLHSKAQ